MCAGASACVLVSDVNWDARANWEMLSNGDISNRQGLDLGLVCGV